MLQIQLINRNALEQCNNFRRCTYNFESDNKMFEFYIFIA